MSGKGAELKTGPKKRAGLKKTGGTSHDRKKVKPVYVLTSEGEEESTSQAAAALAAVEKEKRGKKGGSKTKPKASKSDVEPTDTGLPTSEGNGKKGVILPKDAAKKGKSQKPPDVSQVAGTKCSSSSYR